MQIKDIFGKLSENLDFIYKNLPTGAKTFLILYFLKKFNKILFISEDAEIIYDEIKSMNPEIRVSFYEGENINPFESQIIL